MVKNTQGGSKHKSQARKLVNAPISSKIRISECEDECYARVEKMLGNGMCHVNVFHKQNILPNIICHIRGKFRGRNKKANFVSKDSFVLVGMRSWEININACDLISIYNDHQVELIHFDFNIFNSSIHEHNDNVSFSLNNISSLNLIDIDNDNDNDNDIDTPNLNIIDFDLI